MALLTIIFTATLFIGTSTLYPSECKPADSITKKEEAESGWNKEHLTRIYEGIMRIRRYVEPSKESDSWIKDFFPNPSSNRTSKGILLASEYCLICSQDFITALYTPFGLVELSNGCENDHIMSSKPTIGKSPLSKAIEVPGVGRLAEICTLEHVKTLESSSCGDKELRLYRVSKVDITEIPVDNEDSPFAPTLSIASQASLITLFKEIADEYVSF